LKKYGLFSEKNDVWQDQCEICIYLIGFTDRYLFAVGAAGKNFCDICKKEFNNIIDDIEV
jgi:hypothetical protein